jgi:hypothetical protein
MSQAGEAHKILMQHLEWAALALEELAPLLPSTDESDARYSLGKVGLHLGSARWLAAQIDSGVVSPNAADEADRQAALGVDQRWRGPRDER